MNYDECLAFIHSKSWQSTSPSLHRIENLLEEMGNPQDKLKFIHIAGTNGKGSVSAMTATVLSEAGYKTGLYTSPFILRFNERMRIDGVEISDDELIEITEFVKSKVEGMSEKPTEFDLVTAIAMEYFYRNDCDIVVLEVGMGGTFDSTNIIKSTEVTAITNIGLDHVAVLGENIADIAKAKAGIIKKDAEVILYNSGREVIDTVKKVCEEQNANLELVSFDNLIIKSRNLKAQVFDYADMKDVEIGLLGKFQANNAIMSIKIIEKLNRQGYKITEDNIRQGLKKAKWRARFEVLSENPLIILDGAHNEQGIKAFCESVEDYLGAYRKIFVLGFLADKNVRKMLVPCLSLADEFITVTPNSPRAMSAEDLAELIGEKAVAKNGVSEALVYAVEKADENTAICVFGSLYMAGDVIKKVSM